MRGTVMRDGIRNPFLLASVMIATPGVAGLFLARFGYYRVAGVLAYQPEPAYWYGGCALIAMGGIAVWMNAIRPFRWQEASMGAGDEVGKVELGGHSWVIQKESATFPLLWLPVFLLFGVAAVLQLLALSKAGWADAWGAASGFANGIFMTATGYSQLRYGQGRILVLEDGKTKIRFLFVRKTIRGMPMPGITPLDYRAFFSGLWDGEGEVRPTFPFRLWMPDERFRFFSETVAWSPGGTGLRVSNWPAIPIWTATTDAPVSD